MKQVKKFFPYFSIILLLFIIFIYLYQYYISKPYAIANIISDDITLITEALAKIDKECNILSIKKDNNKIDFLTVIKFKGSEIGPLNLAYPEKWQGPYLNDDPTFKGKYYQIVKYQYKYYIIPGSNVELPNGTIIGKNFNINQNIEKALKKKGALNYRGIPLGSKLPFIVGDFDNNYAESIPVNEISIVNP